MMPARAASGPSSPAAAMSLAVGTSVRRDGNRFLSAASKMTAASVQSFEGPWYEKYLLLEQYKKEHGNCLVPLSFTYGEIRLGIWVSAQRQFYKKGKLSANRREMLDELGFSWDPIGDTWERNFVLLEQFRDREGHCRVPKGHQEDGIKLGNWLKKQRQAFKRGKLNESCQRRLEAIGISWDPHGDSWGQNFALLECYNEREGHCNVPQEYEENGVRLGIWLQVQRGAFRRGKLDESRQSRLDQLGVIWEPYADQWERSIALLQQFKEREGHCNVPQGHEEDDIKLGHWLVRQRQARKGNQSYALSEDRIKRLDEIGIRWSFS